MLSRHVTGSFVLIVLVSFCVLAVMGYAIKQNRDTAKEGAEAHTALCVLRADLERRADDTQAFIDDIEAGLRLPIPGISEADLLRSVTAQRATLEALVDLDCLT